MSSNSYLKFLVATHQILSEFSCDEKLVFDEVIKRGPKDLYRVQEIILMRNIASPATIHKALTNLVSKDYLSLKTSQKDGRVKFIYLSKKSELLVKQLNGLIENSAA